MVGFLSKKREDFLRERKVLAILALRKETRKSVATPAVEVPAWVLYLWR